MPSRPSRLHRVIYCVNVVRFSEAPPQGQKPLWLLGKVETMGLEPTTPCLQSRCSSRLSYVPGSDISSHLYDSTPPL